MISVIVPTLNAEQGLAACLTALVPAAMDGLVREVIISDGGSSDQTLAIADDAGARIIRTERGRGQQLREGARKTKADWLMFIHADSILEEGWEREVYRHIRLIETSEQPDRAAAFRFALDDEGILAAYVSGAVALRCWALRLPYGDQGLLISRKLYDEIGGFKPIELMEDVDLVRRLGRKRLKILRARAVTSANRYRRDGYLKRMLRNSACLGLYYLRVPPHVLARLYG
ncbi:MAG TPA: TIGR04283 family arsenosugar biosynthesis glycosyltransferase [Hyphomicrobiales bacterium]|nr:TIGR04283 family arsenosugar biosynthesis glycosyltransferase [Hyphomicrobiales bacterium]